MGRELRSRRGARRRKTAALAAACAALALTLLGAGQAAAKMVTPYEFSGVSFNGSDSSAGAFVEIGGIGINQQTQDVFVVDKSDRVVSRFDSLGNAVPFSNPPLPGSSVEVDIQGRSYIAVDNSGGSTQGRIYVADRDAGAQQAPTIYAFDASGQPIGGNFPLCGSRCGKPEQFRAEPQAAAVAPDGTLWVTTGTSGFLTPNPAEIIPFTPAGVRMDGSIKVQGSPRSLDLDDEGHIYVRNGLFQDDIVEKYTPQPGHLIGADFPDGIFSRPAAAYPNSNSDSALVVDRSQDLVFVNQADRVEIYDSVGSQVGSFAGPGGGYGGLVSNSRGIAVNETTGDAYVGNNQTDTVDIFERGAPVVVPDPTTGGASDVTSTSAVIHATLDPDGGGDTTLCRFDWGLTPRLENSVPCAEGHVHPSAGGPQNVSAVVNGLVKGRQYHYRLVTTNATGLLQAGRDRSFWAADPPTIDEVELRSVDTDTADVEATIDPQGGGETIYWMEVGETTSYGMTFPLPPANVYRECYFPWLAVKEPPCPGRLLWAEDYETTQEGGQLATAHFSGLNPDTTYHYRVVAENNSGTTTGADHTFHTFAFTPVLEDPCSNRLARQQTGAAQLLDCRAYELVSASDAAGYDVRSDLAPGQAPLPGYPHAEGRALYSVLDGGIPGAWNPTNRGPDPYVATRNAAQETWKTEYVGIPADVPSAAPFSSTLAQADSGLSTFVFGGPEICAPCFDDGSTNVPLRLSSGELTRGMDGSLDPGAADPAGEVRSPISDDGSHLIFGTTAKFEPQGNDNGTDVTIYDRNLSSGTTQVVSTLPDGDTMAVGSEVAQLDVSADGSRIVVAERLGADAAGNDLWHPYMHVGTSPNSIDLAPGTTTGVRYSGMTSDGQAVFYSTPDQLTGGDSDSSADVYRVDIGATTTLTRVSTGVGGAGDTDACTPEPNSINDRWNGADAGGDCSALPIAGGGGIASASGTIYFLSPEQLDGNGDPGEPNLFRAVPGQPPSYVATLESRATGPAPLATSHPFSFSFGSFGNPGAVAVHQGTGDVFVLDANAGTVSKFDSEGNPSDFEATPGSNTLSGFSFSAGLAQVAVDSSGGETDGNIYVTNTAAGTVSVFDSTGAPISVLTGSTSPFATFFFTTGVAVDPSGAIYVGALTGGVYRYTPAGAVPTDADYDGALNVGAAFAVAPVALAADSQGAVYVHKSGADGVTRYSAGQFGLETPSGSTLDPESKAIAIDPADDHAYVSHGDEVIEYLPSGDVHGKFGSADLTNSLGLAINGGSSRIYAADVADTRVEVFGTALGADRRVDSPAVVHGTNDAEERDTSEFQVNPEGDIVVFPSTVPYTGYDSRGTAQVFRYDSASSELVCVSCSRTGEPSKGNASLATDGLSVTDDGRVFFNSIDRLVLRDGNHRQDVYEWTPEPDEDGTTELVSTGVSETDSSLLSVSADGTDAFFFTRQKLVPQDLNGPTVKLYSARSEGGFFILPSQQPCKASDECRGAGSVPAPPATIRTITGEDGQVSEREGGSCNASRHLRRARTLSRRAKSLRRQAVKSSNGAARSKQLRRAKSMARAAKRERDAAQKCRRVNKRSARRAGK